MEYVPRKIELIDHSTQSTESAVSLMDVVSSYSIDVCIETGFH